MTEEEIIARRMELEQQLITAVSTMARKDDIYNIRMQLIELQKKCTHTGKFGWGFENHTCPYCGLQFGG